MDKKFEIFLFLPLLNDDALASSKRHKQQRQVQQTNDYLHRRMRLEHGENRPQDLESHGTR